MSLLAYLKNANWNVYERPYELNLVGFRSRSAIPNTFNDTLVCLFRDEKGRWIERRYPCTTDTGTYWLKNPMMPQGTAMLQAGQYLNAYQLGYHRGKYKALVQVRPVKIRRDYDRDAKLDFLNGEVLTGYYGINIHRASASGTTQFVDQYSAGCQVLANANDFGELIDLADYHASLYGNQFTYGLVDARMQERTIKRRLAYTLSALATASVLVSHFK